MRSNALRDVLVRPGRGVRLGLGRQPLRRRGAVDCGYDAVIVDVQHGMFDSTAR